MKVIYRLLFLLAFEASIHTFKYFHLNMQFCFLWYYILRHLFYVLISMKIQNDWLPTCQVQWLLQSH